MPRESAAAVAHNMLRVIRAVSERAPRDPRQTGAPVELAQLARELDLGEAELERLIKKVNLGCGDAVPELYIEYDETTRLVTPRAVNVALDRPLRLSAAEARGLLTALRSAGIDGEGSLAGKIEGAFPAVDRTRFEAVAGAVRVANLGPVLMAVAGAIEEHHPVRMRYRGLGEAAARERTVEPDAVTYDARERAWYLHAYCRRANGWRTFKLERAEAVEVLAHQTFEPREPGIGGEGGALAAIDDAPMAIVAVHDPKALGSHGPWRGLLPLESPLPHYRRRISDDERAQGAHIAALPWVDASPWLPQAIAQTLGGVEALYPPQLRKAVQQAARTLGALLDL